MCWHWGLTDWVNTLQESAVCPCNNKKELCADISTHAAGRSQEWIIPLYLTPVKPHLQHWHSVWGSPVQERHQETETVLVDGS